MFSRPVGLFRSFSLRLIVKFLSQKTTLKRNKQGQYHFRSVKKILLTVVKRQELRDSGLET